MEDDADICLKYRRLYGDKKIVTDLTIFSGLSGAVKKMTDLKGLQDFRMGQREFLTLGVNLQGVQRKERINIATFSLPLKTP